MSRSLERVSRAFNQSRGLKDAEQSMTLHEM